MNLKDLICNSEFYRDTGFDVIRTWLKNNCVCSLNQEYFTYLTPFHNHQEITDTQLYSDEFLAAFQRRNPLPLETIPDISEWISSLEISGFQLIPENFQQLYQLLLMSSGVKRFLKKSEFPLWHIQSKGLLNSKSAQSQIEKVFDDSFQMKDDASPELKRLIRSFSKTESSIKETLHKVFMRAKQEDWLGGDQIVFRNGRSVLPMKASQKRKVKGIIQDQSATGQTAFVEPLEIIELNNQLTELQFTITEEKHRILRELTAYFQPMSNEIQESFNILKYIDRHFTMAKLAYQIKAIRPEINKGGKIILEEASNPLFALADKNAVSLNLKLNNEKILLLSGPNAGGKTVVLKSLGLYALMAQCGLFIPAKNAQLPIFTRFMADIGDRQSMEDDLSTFSAHIQNLAEIVEEADENTLILLDELGTGTDPDAGAALSRAILETLLMKTSMVVATTHLGSLKVWASEEKGIVNGGMIFDSDALAPTYELQLGIPGASYALEISKRMGLSDDIIKRSKELIGDGSVQLENILGRMEKERLEAESLRIELQQREKKLANTEIDIYNREKEINKTHNKAKSTAAREAEEIILSARGEIESLISDIRNSQADTESIRKTKKQIDNTLRRLKTQGQSIEPDIETLSKKDAVSGIEVFIPNLKSHGKIIHPPDKKNRVRVEANGITLTLKLTELQPISPTEKTIENTNTGFSINTTSTLGTIQIDLRGKRVDEALRETEKFLDSALVSGMGFVHILHGKGTGALMEAIHEYLGEQSFVSNFQFADEDQGGAGITVVEL